MRDSKRHRVIDRINLATGEEVLFVNFILAKPAKRDSKVGAALRTASILLPRGAAKAEGFVVVTDRRVVVVEQNVLTQPTNKIVFDVPRAGLETEYKRGTMPTVYLWAPDGSGTALILGRVWAKRADELAASLSAEP